jgi:N-acetylglucosaminyl-diphospho-decaprenol L-rhamnosyltransferase
MTQPRVAAVVVNYNTSALLVRCVRSLLDAIQRGEVHDIIVVDSSSTDDSVASVRRLLAAEQVISVPNQGYGAAANAGIAASGAAYVLVLNADTEVLPGAVAALASALDGDVRLALVGPRLRHPGGTVQSSMRRFPERLTALFESTIIEEWWPENGWVQRYRCHDLSGDIPQKVDWVVGAALLVRRAAIEQVGAFDTSFRMYSEEVEWCWRLRRHGWSVGYIPGAEIVHYEGASTAQDIPRRQHDFDTSRVLLMERMYGRRHARLIAALLRLGYGLYLARETFKWLLGHRRDLRTQRMRFYARAMMTGLTRQHPERYSTP